MVLPALIPAVAYYRMSSDKQDASIADQRIAVERYAAANGYRILREYIDEGISGWREDRKAFQRLIADAPKGEFKAVLCWDQDRFSRFPVLEANHYWFLLDKSGVHISSVAQGRLDFSTLAGWLTASIAQHGKSEYCRDLARNTTRGLRKRKLAGDWVGSAPLGYRLEGGKLALGDAAAINTVQLIFSMRASGAGYLAIAKHLNQACLPTPRGKRWSQFTVKHVLQRDAYLGCVVIGKHSRAKYERLTDGIVRIDNAHPSIIAQDQWDACREVDKQQHRAHTRNGSEGAPLAGLLRCGMCDSPMYAVTQGSAYYICGKYHCHGECGRCAVQQEPTNRAILETVSGMFTAVDIRQLEAAIDAELKAQAQPSENRTKIASELAAVKQKIANATERLVTVAAAIVPSVEAKLLDLIAIKESLEARLQVAPVVSPKLLAANIAREIFDVTSVLQNGSPSLIRNALSHFIDHVRMDFKQIVCKPPKRRFRLTGAEILFSKGCQHSGRTSPLWSSAPLLFPNTIRLTRLLRAA